MALTIYRLLIGVVLIGWVLLTLFMLSSEPRVEAQQCIPLYSATGAECVQSGCVT